ncbi:hypothetical protein AW736_05450 [Termitidicoccus mucosus]|uniref:histidine kinase n=1 Tax=Termitidicoccus mucosus TaxID=1184151 RepID=A0A178IPQ3_9BACT|nr:hypothetical protein AW736_05450 [Opitutaceae bacterium TSB47]
MIAGSVGSYLAYLPLVRSPLTQIVPGVSGVTAAILAPNSGHSPRTVDDAVALDHAGVFVPMPPSESASVLNRRPREECWYRLIFQNTGIEQHRIILDLIWRFYDYAALYTPQADGGWIETLCGSSVSSQDPRVTRRWVAFELSLPADQPLTVYLHVRDYQRLPAQFFYWPDSTAFMAWERFVFIQHFLFFGLWSGIMVHALFHYAMGRQRFQLYYVGFLFFLGSLEFFGSGLYQLVMSWPERFPIEIIIGIIGAAGLFFLCQFARHYLDAAHEIPRVDRLLRYLCLIPVCVLIEVFLCLWPRAAHFSLQSVMLTVTVFFILMMGISVMRWKAGCHRSGFLLLSFLPYTLTLLLWVFIGPDTVVRDDEVRFAMQIGLALQLVLLTLATAWQHRLLLARNLQLQTNYSARLEKEVDERTRQLTSLSEDLSLMVNDRNRLLSLIGHDLRGPAGSLQALTRILADNPGRFSMRELADLADEIAHACTLQIELLNNLLVWGCAGSAVGSGKGGLPEMADIRTEIVEVCRLLGWTARVKRIEMINDVPASLRAMIAPPHLQVILRNLVVNAIKFTPSGGRIVVSAEAKKTGHIEICVTDSGVGIPPARLAQLLKGPVKSMPGTNEEKGVGFGLSLCRDLAHAARGKLAIQSKEGEGTTVILTVSAAAGTAKTSLDLRDHITALPASPECRLSVDSEPVHAARDA